MNLQEEMMKLSRAFPQFSEERIRLLQLSRKICNREEKVYIVHHCRTDEELRAFIEKKLKNA